MFVKIPHGSRHNHPHSLHTQCEIPFGSAVFLIDPHLKILKLQQKQHFPYPKHLWEVVQSIANINMMHNYSTLLILWYKFSFLQASIIAYWHEGRTESNMKLYRAMTTIVLVVNCSTVCISLQKPLFVGKCYHISLVFAIVCSAMQVVY